jgi:hypothetical protein
MSYYNSQICVHSIMNILFSENRAYVENETGE